MNSKCSHRPRSDPKSSPVSNFLADNHSGPCPRCSTGEMDSINKQRLVRNALIELGMKAVLSRGNTTTRTEIVAFDEASENLYVVRTNWGELNPEDVRRLAFDDLPSIAPIAAHDGLDVRKIIPLMILENDPGRNEGAAIQLCKGLESWPVNNHCILWMRLDELLNMVKEGMDWKDLDLSTMKLSALSTSD